MSYRFMRVIVLFDLPTLTLEDQRAYRRFTKTLKKSGFAMMQESVYCRMLLTPSLQKGLLETLRKNKPPSGLVQVLVVTEKQFAGMEYITGEFHTEVVDSDARLIEL